MLRYGEGESNFHFSNFFRALVWAKYLWGQFMKAPSVVPRVAGTQADLVLAPSAVLRETSIGRAKGRKWHVCNVAYAN